MYHKFIYATLALFLFSPIYANAERVVTTQKPYFQPYYNIPDTVRHDYINPRFYNEPAYRRGYQNSTFSDISALEKYALNRNFPRESDLQRLQRLEMQTFGAIQSGDLDYRYENVRNAILSRPKDNFKTSFVRGLSNYLNGQMTGFTPPIGSSNAYPYTTSFNPAYQTSPNFFGYNQYPTTYDNGSVVNYGTGPFNRGYRINNYSTGSNSGVKILD